MGGIFISYRRDDTEGQAGRLYDDLVEQFGPDTVFMDVAGIEAGRDFRKAIDEHVSSCGLLLALIGTNWLSSESAGRRRLDNSSDFVRLEIAAALKRDVPVVPVLVRGAKMPRAEELPPDCQDLAYRNAVELTHARWDSDVNVLVQSLRRILQPKPIEPAAAAVPSNPPPPSIARRSGATSIPRFALVAALGVIAAIALAVYLSLDPRPEPEASTANPAASDSGSEPRSQVPNPGDAVATTPPPPVATQPADDVLDASTVGYVCGLNPNGDNFLALRAGPGATHPELARLDPDTQLEKLGQSGQWINVRTGGMVGWVHGKWVCEGPPPKAAL